MRYYHSFLQHISGTFHWRNVAATACSQEVQSSKRERWSIKRRGCSLLSASLKFKNPLKTTNYSWKVAVQWRFTSEATKPDWYLPGFLVLICSICDTGTFHCAFVCLSTVCWPDPTGDKGQAPYSRNPKTLICETYPTPRFGIRGCRRVLQSQGNLTRGKARAGMSFPFWHVTEKMTFKSLKGRTSHTVHGITGGMAWMLRTGCLMSRAKGQHLHKQFSKFLVSGPLYTLKNSESQRGFVYACCIYWYLLYSKWKWRNFIIFAY